MKKHKVKKINGVKVVTEIKSDHDRPLLPPGAVFDVRIKCTPESGHGTILQISLKQRDISRP